VPSKKWKCASSSANDEARMTNVELMTKPEMLMQMSILLSSSGFRHSFVLRHSSFVI